jgi:hypothetical protein
MDQYRLAEMLVAERLEEAGRARQAREARLPASVLAGRQLRLAWSLALAAARWRRLPSRAADPAAVSTIGGWSPANTSRAGRMR